MKNIKRISIVFIILVTFILFFVPTIVQADGPSYNITNHSINATILENGNLHIDESFTYKFNSSANGLTRSLRYYYKEDSDSMGPNSSRYQASDITNLQIYVKKEGENKELYQKSLSAENGDSGIYTISNVETKDTKGYDLKVYSPAKTDETQIVYYSYDIEDVIVQYNDMSEIYYNFIGNGIEKDIDLLELNIYFPSSVNLDEVKYYPHTYATKLENIKIDFDKDKNGISFIINDMPSRTSMDARIVFPNTLLMNCTKKYNANYDFDSLYKIEEKMTEGNKKYFIYQSINSIILLVYIIIFIIIIIYAILIAKPFKFSKKRADYYREIPKRLNLLEYQILLPAKLEDSLSSNLIIATILDLVNKKALNMETKVNSKKKGRSKYDYNLTLNEKFDFSTLQPYENQILSLIFSENISTIFNYKQYFSKIVELNSRFKQISKSNKLIKQINKARTNKLISKNDYYRNLDHKSLSRTVIILGIIGIFAIIINTIVNDPTTNKYINIGIGMFCMIVAFGLLILCLNEIFKVIKDEYRQDAKELYGLFRYLLDYSLIKDRYPIEVNIWNEYLVFATLFGIAEKVAKEFREELINNGYSEDQIYVHYPILCVSSFYTSFSNSINTSTGYSGTGSGGGGGRRWGSRSFLKFKAFPTYFK